MALVRVNDVWLHSLKCGVRVQRRWLYDKWEGGHTVADFECLPCSCRRGHLPPLLWMVAAMIVGALVGLWV